MQYPESLEIVPLQEPPQGVVRVPGSKSITNRALVLAALSEPGKGSELQGILRSEDTELMIDCLRQLGFKVEVDWDEAVADVWRDSSTVIPVQEADLFVGNSGTTMRFLTALVSLGKGRYRLDGVARMRERPIEDLLDALRQLGVNAYSERGNGYPPVIVETDGLAGGRVKIKGDVSSQFLSGLLMAAPMAKKEVTLELVGPLVSEPYIDMTLRMMNQFGVLVVRDGGTFYLPAVDWYEERDFAVEPDASAASYFFAAAAVTGGEVTVSGLHFPSLQGDLNFLYILKKMGCNVQRTTGLTVTGHSLRAVDVDMNDISDTVMTLGAVACFAEGPTTIRNVAHIRHKETDRLAALATELRRVGAAVDEFPDGLKITPRPLHGATVETYNDHRMAMSMALIGLKVPGIIIKNPACVAKTYPRFFEDLEQLRETCEGDRM